MDIDRKRQRHQPWCNPNQMQPQTHGVVTVGLALAQRQEIVLEEALWAGTNQEELSHGGC